jgi:hypothetical protein
MNRFREILWFVVFVGCATAAFGFAQTHRSYRIMDDRGYRFGIEILLVGGGVATAAAIPLAKRRRK